MKYVLVGGNPFRHSFTGLRVVASSNDKMEIRKMWDQHYDDCGGLMIIVDTETGNQLQYNDGVEFQE